MKCCWFSATERTGFRSVRGPPRGPSERLIEAVDVVVRKMHVGLENTPFCTQFRLFHGCEALRDTCSGPVWEAAVSLLEAVTQAVACARGTSKGPAAGVHRPAPRQALCLCSWYLKGDTRESQDTPSPELSPALLPSLLPRAGTCSDVCVLELFS